VARTTALVLIAALLVAFVVALASASPAVAAEVSLTVVAPTEDEQRGAHPYAGPDGRSPLDEVPVAPMAGATAGILVVLSVIAVRRGWI
jgi:hypothetical protein